MQEDLRYKAHVIRQVYTSDPADIEAKIEAHEKAWPEYKESLFLNSLRSDLHSTSRTYVSDQTKENTTALQEEGKTWLHKYLNEDVEQLQMMKQHRVHLRNSITKLR